MKLSKKQIMALVVITFVFIISVFMLIKKQENIKETIELIGSDFYENIYYDSKSIGLKKDNFEEVFKDFEEKGLHYNLEFISLFPDFSKKYVYEFNQVVNKHGCSLKDTIIEIKPISPYSKVDYEISVSGDCLNRYQ